MKNSIKSILFILVSLFLFPSCDGFLEDVDVKGDDEIAVVGFISPDDSVVQIALFRAVGVGKERNANTIDYIQNATVRISDEQNSYMMNYAKNPYFFDDFRAGSSNISEPEFTYQLENTILNVDEGKTYFLEVETDKGEKVSAKCTVPVGKVIPTVVLKKQNESNYDYQRNYNYEAEWNDNLNEINYYRLEAYEISTDLIYDQDTGEPNPNEIQKQTTSLNFEKNHFKTQDGRNTMKYNLLLKNKTYSIDHSNPNFPDIILPKPYLITHLMKVDENYYRYHKSVADAYNNEGNPFAEPIIIHSNINNGIGCFGSYITAKVRTEAE